MYNIFFCFPIRTFVHISLYIQKKILKKNTTTLDELIFYLMGYLIMHNMITSHDLYIIRANVCIYAKEALNPYHRL